MGKSQRTKGATYEREVRDAFNKALGTNFQRNIGQARDGGCDIPIGPFAVEAKRRKTLTTIEGWLQQSKTAAINLSSEHMPIVVTRSDGGRSMALLDLDDFLKILLPYWRSSTMPV